MTHRKIQYVLLASVLSGLCSVSCKSEKKSESSQATPTKTTTQNPAAKGAPAPAGATKPMGTRTVDVEPGVAGGTIDDTVMVAVKVGEVDAKTRKVTLVDDEGHKATFTAGPEVKNFDQIRPGDKLTATLNERLVVYVRSAAEQPNDAYAAALASAPKGAKPGALMSESYQVVAAITAIDSAKRTATLKFADGTTRTVPIRSDVDLSRYKVGDSVVIRVTSTLAILASRP
jgi:hypothetical protein